MDERERRMDKGRNFKCNPHGKRFFAVITRRFGPNRVFFSCYKLIIVTRKRSFVQLKKTLLRPKDLVINAKNCLYKMSW